MYLINIRKVKLSMKACNVSGVLPPFNLTSVLDGVEWSTSSPGRFSLGKGRRYPANRRLDGVDVTEKKKKFLAPRGIQTADRPAQYRPLC
jgi:hypothetical protein